MITHYVCPIPECGWTHWIPQSQNAADGNSAAAAISGYMDSEKVVTAHLETHPALQWSIELRRANRQVELLKTQLALAMGAPGAAAEDAADANRGEIRIGLKAMATTIQEAILKND